MSQTHRVLGVDCNRVIYDVENKVIIEGCIEGLRDLERLGIFQKVYIVSKYYSIHLPLERKLSWHHFWTDSGIPTTHLHTCWTFKRKASICRKLGVTDFIDDHLEVHGHLYRAGIPRLYAFRPSERERITHAYVLPYVALVENWPHCVSIIKATI